MALEAATVKATYDLMVKKLAHVVPEFELKEKSELVYAINKLKKEKDAIILGHNYMEPVLFHSIPDFVGDSLELCRKAAQVEQKTMIFCGVRFMAETAKVLNPSKTVLLPAKVAGCSLASSITAEDVRNLRKEYPGVPIVTYINTYADVKAECDIVCTSGNAVKIVESFDQDVVIFIPDEYLAKNVAKESSKEIIFPQIGDKLPEGEFEKRVIVSWQGKCEVHDEFTLSDVRNAREQFPDAMILAHPECPPEVVDAADFTGSTSKMIQAVKSSRSKRFLLLTECSMADNILAEAPDKEMVRMCSVRCPHMNEITLEDTLHALEHNETIIDVPEEIRKKASLSIERMLSLS